MLRAFFTGGVLPSMARRSLILVLAACSGSSSNQCELAGTWDTALGQVTYDAGGSYHVGTAGPTGTWQLSGDQLSITGGCNGEIGVYRVSFSSDCNSATLHLVSDSCSDRASGADGLVGTRTR
jgi:hypothetical protein